MRNTKGQPGEARAGSGRKVDLELQRKIFKFYLHFPDKPLTFIAAPYGVTVPVVSRAISKGLQRKL